jgi:predicted dehydrogenase
MAKSKSEKQIRCAAIGYGASFNMGLNHANWINATDGLTFVAVSDIDPARAKAAGEELPGIKTFTRNEELLAEKDVDLVVIITPHNTHAELALQCLNAGKHVVLEKPMCITVEEADEMIATAKRKRKTVTVFHNRRHDGDYLALKEIVEKGLIGDVFNVEMNMGGYGKPRKWWRSDKEISGGAFYDWGAHMLDWLLHIVPQRIEHVVGHFHQDLVWNKFTAEDHVHALITFESGATADVQLSSVQAIGKPRWRVLGTKGAVVDTGEGKFRVVTFVKGYQAEIMVPYKESSWQAYYDNLSAHLREGKDLEVTPESSRRTIGIIRAAEKSSATGKPEEVPHEDTLWL